MGDAVPFIITGTVSAKYADYNNYFYSFVDSMDKGLTYNGDAKVYVVNGEDETEVTEQFIIATTQNAETNLANGFTAAANLKALTDVSVSADSKIVVKYTCTLNSHAVTGTAGNKNQVYLEYENDPYRVESPMTRSLVKPESLSRTPNKINTVFTFETAVNKIDKSGNPLAGAGFTLYKWIKDGIVVGEQNADGWVAVGDEITGVTTFQFIGLDAGKYKLVETTVPAGYNKCDDIEFSIAAEYDLTVEPNTLTGLKVLDNLGLSISEGENAAFAADPATGIVTTSVVNLTGAQLPGTGGIGTYIFYGVGACLVLAAVVLLVTKKRMAA
jgi:fimbrial isopeptide formation D2 family protein/LPXTG-motif cell wall-anchored protein